MKSHFIKGTDEQYSIREDGQITRHYKWRGRKEYGNKVYEDVIMTYKPYPKRQALCVIVKSNNKTFRWFKNTLLTEYFGFIICPNCDKKHRTTTHVRVCPSCIKEKKYLAAKKWRMVNPEKAKLSVNESYNRNSHKYIEGRTINNKKKREEISRGYVASKLNISVSDLSDQLYHSYKNLLLFKRKVSKKHNIPIHTLK